MQLADNPILIQELETRSRFPGSYRGFVYEGPGLALILFGFPLFAVLAISFLTGSRPGGNEASLLICPTAVYTLYLCYASARLAGGSIAADNEIGGRHSLYSLPIRAWDFVLGKFLGALLPLYIELLLVTAVLVGLSLLGWAPVQSALAMGAYMFGLITWFGLWGLYWSSGPFSAEMAVSRSRLTVTVFSFILPMASMIGLHAWRLPLLKVACTEAIFFNPLVSLYAASAYPALGLQSPIEAAALIAWCVSAVTGLALLSSILYRLSSEGGPVLSSGHHLHGHYVIEGVAGQGAMSCVYRARNVHTPAIVWAIKEMRSDGMPEQDREAAEALFEHEARLLSRLSHPALPKVVDFFSEGSCHYLVMEYITGLTLETLLERHRLPFREAEVIPVAVQLASCLKYLHNQPEGPIIFRDLKPSNVMIEPDSVTAQPWNLQGHVKLVDFGIARMFKPGKNRDTQPLGTPGFAAPEQYGARQTTPRSDLFSLGATIHYLMTAVDPDPAGVNFQPLRKLVPGGPLAASEAMEALVIRLLDWDPEKRPGSADEVLDTLQQIRRSAPGVLNHLHDSSVPTRIDLPYLVEWFRRTFSLRSVGGGPPSWWVTLGGVFENLPWGTFAAWGVLLGIVAAFLLVTNN